MRYLCLSLFTCALAACAPATWTVHSSGKPDRSETIHLFDPTGDLAKSLAAGDQRFVGIMGVALYLPGVPPEAQLGIKDNYGIKVIDGITDVENDTSARIRGPARDYAEKYNTALLLQLAKLKAATQPPQ